MFKIGDVVQVKSGGPAMSVLTEGDQIECLWFAEVAEVFHREMFPAICLEAIDFEEGEEEKADEEDKEDDED